MIEITVGLPMYRTKYIGWLALESLCRQQVDAEWELLIAEEQDSLCMGREAVDEFSERLKEAGCERIVYLPLDEWIPLAKKWRLLADHVSEGSEVFIIHAADCYSAPGRLSEALRLVREGADWVQYPQCYLCNLADEKIVRFSGVSASPCTDGMAARMELFRAIPSSEVGRSVDHWLFHSCQKAKGSVLNLVNDKTGNWELSINVNGINNISCRRERKFKRLPPGFHKTKRRISEILPGDVTARLIECKKHLNGWTRLRPKNLVNGARV